MLQEKNGRNTFLEFSIQINPLLQLGRSKKRQGNICQQTGNEETGSAAMPYAAGWSTNLPRKTLQHHMRRCLKKRCTGLDIEDTKNANPLITSLTGSAIEYRLIIRNTCLAKGNWAVELNYPITSHYKYADVYWAAAKRKSYSP